MSNTQYAIERRKETEVEALLQKAKPRPVPPADDERRVRDAVRAEWHAVTGKRHQRRRIAQFAIAATVLVAVTVTFNVLRNTGIQPERVATIDKDHGSIYLLGDESELQELRDLATIVVGQTIVTGDNAGMGLSWDLGGGSLRLDENSTVEFTSPTAVYLRSGRIYYDSRAVEVAAIAGSGGGGSRNFVVVTDHGEIIPLGTQYMTAVDGTTLVVSVREGEVEIDGRHKAREGQQLRMSGSGSPSVTNFSRSGESWAWAEAVAPTLDFSGWRTHDFLEWVGRETGYSIRYDSTEARKTAEEGILRGSIPGIDPRMELEIRMGGEDLSYTIDDEAGTIIVSSINLAS